MTVCVLQEGGLRDETMEHCVQRVIEGGEFSNYHVFWGVSVVCCDVSVVCYGVSVVCCGVSVVCCCVSVACCGVSVVF